MHLALPRWVAATLLVAAIGNTACGKAPTRRPHQQMRAPIVEDDSLVHAFDTHIETRLIDRLQLDNFLRHRAIHLEVIDGDVLVTGEVWTSLEKERVTELLRAVPGVVDVSNELYVRPPA